MPRINAANNARTVLAQAVGTSDTTIYVQDVSKFPAPPFRITVDAEIMEVTAVDANLKALTVSRAQEGTTAATHSIGAAVENRWTAGTYAELATQVAVDAVQSSLTSHLAEKASSTVLGHVKQGSGVTISDGVISANVTSVAGKTGAVTLTKSDVGLGNVDNMSALSIRTDNTKRLVTEVSSSAPSSPVNGQIWYDSVNHKFKGYANGAWV